MRWDDNKIQKAYTGTGTLINSDFLNGLTVEDAKKLIIDKLRKLALGKKEHFLGSKIGVFQDKDIGDVLYL